MKQGLLILTIQAHVASLKPPPCILVNTNSPCQEVDGAEAVMLFAGLYLVALGVGGIKGSLPPHGAEQFDDTTPQGRKQRSSYFNYYVFCLSCGALVAVTFVVWIEDNKGWQWGFGISTAAILISIPLFLLGSPTYRIKFPSGSPIATMFKVEFRPIEVCTTSLHSWRLLQLTLSFVSYRFLLQQFTTHAKLEMLAMLS
jgi:peptide/histidine transporter 3/4